ncbi:MAG: PilZ domain-containing protein [Planctomycetota bacterium]|jgi:hypothetical protein
MTPTPRSFRGHFAGADPRSGTGGSNVPGDRRDDPRIELNRPCKVYDVRGQRYLAGMTWNVSRGGMCLEVDRPLELSPGDSIYVGIAARRREAVLCQHDMIEARVVRSTLTVDDRTTIAVTLAKPALADLPIAAEPIAA